jgi:predicted amidohydrolase
VRAFENQVFVAYADNADREGAFAYQGQSIIAAPDGAVLASAPVAGDALIYARIDPARYLTNRQENPYLSDAQTGGLA